MFALREGNGEKRPWISWQKDAYLVRASESVGRD